MVRLSTLIERLESTVRIQAILLKNHRSRSRETKVMKGTGKAEQEHTDRKKKGKVKTPLVARTRVKAFGSRLGRSDRFRTVGSPLRRSDHIGLGLGSRPTRDGIVSRDVSDRVSAGRIASRTVGARLRRSDRFWLGEGSRPAQGGIVSSGSGWQVDSVCDRFSRSHGRSDRSWTVARSPSVWISGSPRLGRGRRSLTKGRKERRLRAIREKERESGDSEAHRIGTCGVKYPNLKTHLQDAFLRLYCFFKNAS